MTADIRTPAEEDREQIVDLLRTSLNFTRAWAEDRGPLMPVADYRCAYEDHRIVAAAAGYRFRQWFGGHDLPMSGIYAVATLPEHRETGLASAAVLQILREARDHGMSVSTLFPAVLRPYRKLGYELGGTFSEHRLDLDAIPSDLGDHLPAVELLDPDRDLDGLKTCYREWSRHGNGPLEPTDDTWWTRRIATPFRFRWMFRLLDVRGALAERGYPAVDVEVVVAVADPQFPENAGPWRVSVRGGVASVDPAPGTDVRPLPIGVLSSLFSGFLRVPDAVRMGHLDRNDPAVPGLQQLFAGADPWCPFFF